MEWIPPRKLFCKVKNQPINRRSASFGCRLSLHARPGSRALSFFGSNASHLAIRICVGYGNGRLHEGHAIAPDGTCWPQPKQIRAVRMAQRFAIRIAAAATSPIGVTSQPDGWNSTVPPEKLKENKTADPRPKNATREAP